MHRALKVAAIISAYNEERLVGKTIDTLPGFVDEIIVTNDGSTDDTKGVLERKAAADPRITVVDNPQNLGLGASLRTRPRGLPTPHANLPSIHQQAATRLGRWRLGGRRRGGAARLVLLFSLVSGRRLFA